MGLDTRKPGGLSTTKAQTRLRKYVQGLSSPTLFAYWKSIISGLATSEISIFRLVSVAEQADLNLTWWETLKTGFLALRPICDKYKNLMPWPLGSWDIN